MKKLILAALCCAALGAAESRYDLTPTIGGVIPEGNTDLKNQLTAGLRAGKYLEDSWLSKLEIGFEWTKTHYEDMGPGKSRRQALITRYFAHGIKEFDITESTHLYGLLGLGWENIQKKARYGNNDSPYANYGVGVRQELTDDLSLRAELRHAIKLHSGHADNNLFATLGLSYAFGDKAGKTAETAVIPAEEPVKTAVVENKSEADSDGDGVPDSLDACPNTPANTPVNSSGCAKSVTLKVNFPFGVSELTANSKNQIASVAEILKSETDYRVVLAGHTDSIGTEEFNLALSEKRVKNVANELIVNGVAENRINVNWFGKTQPVATNRTPEGRAENRRVESDIVK